jgi:hypothetical protein
LTRSLVGYNLEFDCNLVLDYTWDLTRILVRFDKNFDLGFDLGIYLGFDNIVSCARRKLDSVLSLH